MRWAAAETRSALPVAAVADLRLAGTVACAALGVLFCLLGGGVLFLAGAGASALWSGWAALPALAVWQVLFWRQVHWDPERAFERYDLKQK